MKRQLEEARAELLAPLRAASMESYARAYPHLVRSCRRCLGHWVCSDAMHQCAAES